MTRIPQSIILAAVIGVTNIPLLAIKGNAGGKRLIRARFAAAYLLRTLRPDLSFGQIGATLGRDQSTIRNACGVADRWLLSDREFSKLFYEAHRIAVSGARNAPQAAENENQAPSLPKPEKPDRARSGGHYADPPEVIEMRRDIEKGTAKMRALLLEAGNEQ